MCPFISWCNANEGFISAIFAFCNFVISAIAIWLSIKAICQTKRQIQISDIQQSQNVALTLLPLRKNVLQLFSEEKYSELLWDAQILFDDSTVSEIKKTKNLYDELKELHVQIEEYENKMAVDMPDLYDEYRHLLANIEQADFYEVDGKSLYDLCETYIPVVNDVPMHFQTIHERCVWVYKQYSESQKSTLELMKEDIRKKTTT